LDVVNKGHCQRFAYLLLAYWKNHFFLQDGELLENAGCKQPVFSLVPYNGFYAFFHYFTPPGHQRCGFCSL